LRGSIGVPIVKAKIKPKSCQRSPALRAALMDYRLITSFAAPTDHGDVRLSEVRDQVKHLWDAYQESRFGYVAGRLPMALAGAQAATETHSGDEQVEARRLLALAYQLGGVQLTKFGEAELAWIAADRGLVAARQTGDPVVLGSLFRSVTHALLSTGRYAEAVQLTDQAAGHLEPAMSRATPELLSIYGTLFLAGSMAAARANDAGTTRTFLAAADAAARRLGGDANHVWTAFGPTNVAIHRVATAAELGDIQVAVDLGSQVDTSALPTERRVRHALEVARALSSWNRADEALATLLEAERIAPEQVRYHFLSRQLVLTWIRQQRTKPSATLANLAKRLKVLD